MYKQNAEARIKALADKKDWNILAFETSCDDTSVSIVRNGRQVLSGCISSQIEIHNTFGGVVPEVASRKHIENIGLVLDEAMRQAGMDYGDIDAVASTYGPGLVGALLVGLNAAKSVSLSLGVPFVGVNHMEAHVCANYISSPKLEPPFLCLVVSGGHTQIVAVNSYSDYKILGQTLDDAAGEAFDKISRELGLGYPGGPYIQRAAEGGDPKAIPFPKARIKTNELDFSFSGLKTSVLNYIHNNKDINVNDVAASFQYTAVSDLVSKTMLAAEKYGYKKIALAGGVAANRLLREMLGAQASKRKKELFVPEFEFCTDNASMVACAAYYKLKRGLYDDLSMNANPALEIGEV
ncbi:MAG: tRNA (adenosine(37)-N6)-threonylcarbamoyltransferase complex transferase subunit TsaD [Clostridia bacterium]|nr:tRNA (adenosine(37)-N6)-threonylcarbamoyltransferase complex transferase subunit TsaD [Clostridia bacterium]